MASLLVVAHAQISFDKPDFDTGKGPVWVAAADFNRDGLLDVVTANSADNSVTVLLNNGNATFGRRTDYPVGKNPVAVVTGDFNNDGFTDVAVSNKDDNTITILLGNGDGTLRSFATFAVGKNPGVLIAADFNKDGKTDLAVVNSGSNAFSVFLGNGNGTFTLKADYPSGPNFTQKRRPDWIVTADFNGDSVPDLAVTNGGADNVSIFLGNGDGTFRAAGNLNILGGANQTADGRLLAADFNQDGKIDLLVEFIDCGERSCDEGAEVFAGHGDGTFDAGHGFPIFDFNPPMVAADLNGDHVPDVVTGGNVVLVNPATVFSSGSTSIPMFTAGLNPASLVAGDFSGHGKMDVVSANSSDDTVSLLQGNGDGTFHQRLRFPLPDSVPPDAIVSADFNRDGVPDVVLKATSSKGFLLYLANGDGTFRAPVHMSTDLTTYLVAAVDVNHDGIPDIVANGLLSNGTQGVIRVFLGNGDGTFRAPIDSPSEVGSFQGLIIADFNGDGIADVALHTFDGPLEQDAIEVYFGTGNGSFQPPVKTVIRFASQSMAIGDFNGDGKMDVVVGFSNIDDGGDNFTIYLGNGDGTFRKGQTYAVQEFAASLAVADLNHDGQLDIVVSHARSVGVFLGNGDGTFTQKADMAAYGDARQVRLVDINSDGVPDIILANQRISIWLGKGDGTFQARQDFGIGGVAEAVIGDFNRDGAPDVVVASSNFATGSLSLMLNGNGPPAARDFHLSLSTSLATVKAGQPATATVSVAAVGNFADAVTFSCSGLPSGTACSFSPVSVMPAGASAANSTLTITTTARSSGALVPAGTGAIGVALGLPVCAIVFAGLRRRNRWKSGTIFAMLLLALLLFQGCGGVGGGGNNGGSGGGGGGNSGGSTPSGTFTVTITGTSGGAPVLTHSQPITLNVQ